MWLPTATEETEMLYRYQSSGVTPLCLSPCGCTGLWSLSWLPLLSTTFGCQYKVSWETSICQLLRLRILQKMLVLSSTFNSGIWYMLTHTVLLLPTAFDFTLNKLRVAYCCAYNSENRGQLSYIHFKCWYCQQDRDVPVLTGVLVHMMVLASSLSLFD